MFHIAIISNGSSQIGMGHIMRCISLAKEFVNLGVSVVFISKFKEGIEKIKAEGFEVLENLNPCKYHLILADTYDVDHNYFYELKKFASKIAYIDDINRFVYPVDILINGNITGEYMHYERYSENELLLLGTKYNLIRSEFKNIPERQINQQVKSIMITTGGADEYNLCPKLARALLEDPELCKVEINIIVGGAFTNQEELRNLGRTHTNIQLHENVSRISEIMLASDMAISASGSTLYELCACGTPTLAFILADNQEFIAQKMSEMGYIEPLGWYHVFSEGDLTKQVRDLSKNFEKREAMVRRMQKLVDGEGARRTAEKILEEMCKEKSNESLS